MTAYEKRRYLLMTHDPVHIGAGGYRLGRVDNSIVREPGTRLPKIPGTSLHGAARSYAARLYENLAAAGQKQEGDFDPDHDPICYTFGYIRTKRDGDRTDEDTTAYSGVVNVFDALLTLFPVHSRRGPVWVSTQQRLVDAGFTVGNLPDPWPADTIALTWAQTEPLNLGWLMMPVTGAAVTVEAPPDWQADAWSAVASRIALVDDSLFSAVVNSNLEVRTSVSINPETGAAEDKALFTYEALPRATFLTCDVVLDDYRDRARVFKAGGFSETLAGKPLPGGPWAGPMDVFEAGLGLLEWFGVGGMGTRGFGRVGRVGAPVVNSLV